MAMKMEWACLADDGDDNVDNDDNDDDSDDEPDGLASCASLYL